VIPGTGNGAAVYFEDGVPTTRQLMGATFTTDAQGQLAAFSEGPLSGIRGSGNAVDVGSNLAAGNLHWGMWPDATVNGFPVTHLHFIVGDVASLPGTGIFDYVPVGGTRPTNEAGLTGTFVVGTVRVDFTPGTLTLNNWQVAFNGAQYNQSGATVTFGKSPAFTGPVTWSCTGTCGTSPPSGNIAGAFTGAGATGMGIVYTIPDGSGPNGQITGAQGFQR
jgi:hypothetical protein